MGCGESKHAVATTESLSRSKRFNSQNSKKVHNNVEQTNSLKRSKANPIDVSNDTKKITIEKTNNEVSANKSCTSPDLNKKETPEKVFNVEDVTKDVEEHAAFDDDKNNSSLNKPEETLNELNLVGTCDIQEKENEGDKKELHLESKDDSLLVKETNFDIRSPADEDKVESPIKMDENSSNFSEMLNNKHEEQISEVKVLEPFENQEKEIKRENKEFSCESRDDNPSANDANTASQSLSCEPVEESIVKEDVKSIDMLNDERIDQMKTINVDNQENDKEAENNEPSSQEFHVDQLSINNVNTENRSPSPDNIVEIEKKEDVESINLPNETNQSINIEDEMPKENSSAQVSSEATNEVKKQDS